MFKWITNKVIDNYIKDKIKEIQAVDIRNKVKDYVAEHKDIIIEGFKQAIENSVKEVIDEIIQIIKEKRDKLF